MLELIGYKRELRYSFVCIYREFSWRVGYFRKGDYGFCMDIIVCVIIVYRMVESFGFSVFCLVFCFGYFIRGSIVSRLIWFVYVLDYWFMWLLFGF